MAPMTTVLGIDVGGTGIKGAPVDTRTGQLLADRHRILTPQPATPDAVAGVVGELARHFDWTGPAGATFPAVMKHGVAQTAANVDRSWIGADAAALFAKAIGGEVTVVNDADAAGIAEMHFGAGRGHDGVVLVITLGTGIGSALFVEGVLVPNTEFGHLQMDGRDAEHIAAESVREQDELSWKKWSKRLNDYLQMLEGLFSPDLFVIGGGVSKKSGKFIPRLDLSTEVVPAELLNEAGIVGGALAHAERAGAPPAD
jgi:polyphosphate glucokinase